MKNKTLSELSLMLWKLIINTGPMIDRREYYMSYLKAHLISWGDLNRGSFAMML